MGGNFILFNLVLICFNLLVCRCRRHRGIPSVFKVRLAKPTLNMGGILFQYGRDSFFSFYGGIVFSGVSG
jgi:hypothetical protein